MGKSYPLYKLNEINDTRIFSNFRWISFIIRRLGIAFLLNSFIYCRHGSFGNYRRLLIIATTIKGLKINPE